MIIPNYTPFGNRTPKPDPPEDVPLAVFKAAQRAGASYLSKNGSEAYMKRYSKFYKADWSRNGLGFGSWKPIEALPADAVELP